MSGVRQELTGSRWCPIVDIYAYGSRNSSSIKLALSRRGKRYSCT